MLKNRFMLAASNPDLVVAQIAIGGFLLAGLWRLISWVRNAPIRPDPWDAETEQKLQQRETPEICHHGSTPQAPGAWFCSQCGASVGPYNNLMPYVQAFAEGEVYRNGMSSRFRNPRLIPIGFFLMTLAINPLFAPIYLFLLLPQLKRSRGG
jgi:hypothetical protein